MSNNFTIVYVKRNNQQNKVATCLDYHEVISVYKTLLPGTLINCLPLFSITSFMLNLWNEKLHYALNLVFGDVKKVDFINLKIPGRANRIISNWSH